MRPVSDSIRYSQQPFPAYVHVPGETPHPTRDPAGHSYDHPDVDIPVFDPSHWMDSEAYRYGVDLHNHGYYWETHEVLEGLWRTLPRETEAALFLQGLIQLSVAHSHARHRGRPDLAVKLTRWAQEKWIQVEGAHYAGMDMQRLKTLADTWAPQAASGTVPWILQAPGT